MKVLSVLQTSPGLLKDKSVKQIIGIVGNGKLGDGNETSLEFRGLLNEVTSDELMRFANECLDDPFLESGLVLQDVINEVGRRLGFEVTNGRYRGKKGEIGNDGLWSLPNGHSVVVEVKTTDAYRIDLDSIAAYRRSLIQEATCQENKSSVLVIVGRTDTGDLEAQIRGSRHAWSMRLLSVEGLLRLMQLKESFEDPDALRRIYEILIPREFTKLDEIVDLVFSTAEDAKQVDELPDEEAVSVQGESETSEPGKPKFTPVSFHSAVATAVSKKLGVTLLKRTRALFSSSDDSCRVLCSVSRKYSDDHHTGYWFAFHPHQRESLEAANRGFVAFGCGSADLVVVVPVETFATWLSGMNMTVKDDRHYWHVHIHHEDDHLVLVRSKGADRIDLAQYTIQTAST